MEELQRRLEKAGVWDWALEMEVRALWKYGVEPIRDERLRATVARFLGIVPLAFYTDVASKSGRFHPPWQRKRHGTLRSIVESCALLPGWARHIPEILDDRMEPDPRAVDLALAATIVSDVWKKEDAGDVHHGAEHGRVAAERWAPFARGEGLDAETVDAVADASVWHMGLYAPGWTRATVLTPITRLVNFPDVATSLSQLAIVYEGRTVIL